MLNKIKVIIDGKEKKVKLDELQLTSLRLFRKKYPSATSGDIQTFIIANQILLEEMIKI